MGVRQINKQVETWGYSICWSRFKSTNIKHKSLASTALSTTSSPWGLEFYSSNCSYLQLSHPSIPIGLSLYCIINEPLTTAQRDLRIMVDTHLKSHTYIRQSTAKAGEVELATNTILKSAHHSP